MKKHNLFISHSWKYSIHYNSLIRLLEQRPYFQYKNHSVSKDFPLSTKGSDRVLRVAITNKMQGCHVVLILAGKYATYSHWINNEIAMAKNGFFRSKPIIGIKPFASTVVSRVVREHAVEVVNWNTESIVNAIRRHSNA
jgi:hypothetical protein